MKFEERAPDQNEDSPRIVLRSLGNGRYAAELCVVHREAFWHTAAYVRTVAGEALCGRSA